MIIGLALLIALLFGGGPEEIFMVPDLKKEVRKNVTEKQAKKDLYVVISNAKKEIKAFRKKSGKYTKSAKKVAKDYQADLSELESIFDLSINLRKDHQQSMIESRLKFQDLMTDEEWNNMVRDQIELKKKPQKKKDKSKMKSEEAEKKMFNKMRETIETEISNEETRMRIDSSFTVFENALTSLFNEKRDYDLQDNKMLGDRHATREDLEEYYSLQDSIRAEMYKSYFNLLKVSHEILTEKEWKAIGNAFQKVYK